MVSEDLKRAADILENRGKCNRAYVEADGRLCAIGAILAAVGCDPVGGLSGADEEQEPRVRQAERALCDFIGRAVVPWSDRTTTSEVVGILRLAAAAAAS